MHDDWPYDRPCIDDLISTEDNIKKNFFVRLATEHRCEPFEIKRSNFCFSSKCGELAICFNYYNCFAEFSCCRCRHEYDFLLKNESWLPGCHPIFYRTPELRERFKESHSIVYDMVCADCKLHLGQIIRLMDPNESCFFVVNDSLLENITPGWISDNVLRMLFQHFRFGNDSIDTRISEDDIEPTIKLWIDKGIREGSISNDFYITKFIRDCDILFKRKKMIDNPEHRAFIKRVSTKDKKLADEFYQSAKKERIVHVIKLFVSKWEICDYQKGSDLKRDFVLCDSKPDEFIIIQGETFAELFNMVTEEQKLNYKELIKGLA